MRASGYTASAVTLVSIKFIPEQSQRAHDRGTGHVDERAVSLAAIEIDDLLELSEQRLVAFTLLDALEHRGQHRGLHAAGGTLAARFAGEELRNTKRFFDHARSLCIEAHDTAA